MTNKGLDPNFHDSGTGGMDIMIKSHPKTKPAKKPQKHWFQRTYTWNTPYNSISWHFWCFLMNSNWISFYHSLLCCISTKFILFCVIQFFIILDLPILFKQNRNDLKGQRSMHFKAQSFTNSRSFVKTKVKLITNVCFGALSDL